VFTLRNSARTLLTFCSVATIEKKAPCRAAWPAARLLYITSRADSRTSFLRFSGARAFIGLPEAFACLDAKTPADTSHLRGVLPSFFLFLFSSLFFPLPIHFHRQRAKKIHRRKRDRCVRSVSARTSSKKRLFLSLSRITPRLLLSFCLVHHEHQANE